MQCIRELDSDVSPQLCGAEENALGHIEQSKFSKQSAILALKNSVGASDWPDQALAFNEGRNNKIGFSFQLDCVCNRSAPQRMFLDHVNDEAAVQINHSQEFRSSSI